MSSVRNSHRADNPSSVARWTAQSRCTLLSVTPVTWQSQRAVSHVAVPPMPQPKSTSRVGPSAACREVSTWESTYRLTYSNACSELTTPGAHNSRWIAAT